MDIATWIPWRKRRGETKKAPEKISQPYQSGSLAAAPVSQPPDTPGGLAGIGQEFLPLPDRAPFEMLRVYRILRDAVPDISDAIWTWKRLCQTTLHCDITAASESAVDEARERIAALDRRVNSGDGGMAVLLDLLYASLFTYGAAALEMVPGREHGWIWDVIPVDVWTLRFRREKGRPVLYQRIDGESIALPMARIIYLGLDRDGTNPYGRSMLRSIPFAVKIQQRLLEDMSKAMHNTGWSRLHLRHTPDPRQPGESSETYAQRAAKTLESLRERLSGLAPDQNLITHDNVAISVLRGEQQAMSFYDNHKAVEEQVITGLHMMPVLMGRNYGSTETYGTAQFEVVNRQVETVNRMVGAALERLYNTELAAGGVPARVAVRLGGNRTVDILKEAEARSREIDNVLRLCDARLMTPQQARETLGLH